MTAVPPRINPKLNMFDPITFPIDISVCFVIAALIVTANSGAEVPKATTVRPMIKSDTLGYVLSLLQNQQTSQLLSKA